MKSSTKVFTVAAFLAAAVSSEAQTPTEEAIQASKEINLQISKWTNNANMPSRSWKSTKHDIIYSVTSGYPEYVSENELDQILCGRGMSEQECLQRTQYIDYDFWKFTPHILDISFNSEIGGCPEGTVYRQAYRYFFKRPESSYSPKVEWAAQYFIFSDEAKANSGYLNLLDNCNEFIFLGQPSVPILASTPRKETLYLTGQQNSAPSSFNPLAESWATAWPISGRHNLMYEPLVVYNTLNGQMEPLLGTLREDLSDNENIVVDLNPQAKWSDGKPVSSRDVKFTYLEAGRNFENMISEIKVSSSSKGEQLTFVIATDKSGNHLTLRDILQSTKILPAHVFSKMIESQGVDKAKQEPMMNEQHVVSGPYNLMSADNDAIVLKRVDNYWGNKALHKGNKPTPKFIVHSIYKAIEQNTTNLRDGNIDVSMSFVPRVNRKKAFGVSTWYNTLPYYPQQAMPMLIINTQNGILGNKIFRKAMATAIDYDKIQKFAVSNYSATLKPGLIIPGGLEDKYVDDSDLKSYGIKTTFKSHDERNQAVRQMLSSIGIESVWNEDGSLSHMKLNGRTLNTLYITTPAGWTDWEALVSVAVNGMRQAGIDVQEKFVDGGSYWPAMGLGDFDLVIHKPVADAVPSLPWSRFNEVMSSREWTPMGQWAGTNTGRYNQPGSRNYRPEVDKLLEQIPNMNSPAKKAKAYQRLNQIFMEDQPAIPLAYLPEQFFEYSDKVWTNWPNENNPYAPPLIPGLGAGTNILWQLKQK